MRTTLTIDDELAAALKEVARESGKSFKEVVNEALRRGLHAPKAGPETPYRVKPVSMGSARADFDLDKALALADHLEDAAIHAKLTLRK